MAVGELIIDDDYVKSMGRFYRTMGMLIKVWTTLIRNLRQL